MIAMIVAAAFGVGAEEIDSTNARIRLAVPDVLVIDNLVIEGEAYVAYLSADDDGRWTVTSLDPQVESVIPAAVVLDLARLSFSPEGTLEISDIYLDGEFYSGSIDFSDDLRSVERFSFDPAEPPTVQTNPLLAELVAILAADEESVHPAPTVLEEPLEPIAPDGSEENGTDAALSEPSTAEEGATEASTAATTVDLGRYDAAIADLVARVDRVEHAVTTLTDEGAARATQIQRAIAALTAEVEGATGEATAMSVRLTAIERATQTLLERSARIEEVALAISETPVVPTGSHEVELEPAPERPPVAVAPTTTAPTDPVEALSPTISLEWARARFAPPTAVDLSNTTVLRGDWDLTATTARQNDSEELFAKLDLPFVQDGRPRLYRMLTRALDPEWVGVGIHLTVNDVELPRGYGHGRSLLVWLTRDPATYGNDDTYLEVYRSFDDVNMDRIAQAHIETSLAERHALEILVDPAAGYITLAVNGVEYLRYRLDAPIEAGFSLAIRSLGRAEFRELEYRTIRE